MDVDISDLSTSFDPRRRTESSNRQAPCGNRLLNRLPREDIVRLLPRFQRVMIAAKQVLHHRHLPMQHVYFVESGLISVLARTADQQWVEAWSIGSDASTAIPVLLGDGHPLHRLVVQIGGSALRIPTPEFRALLQQSKGLRSVLLNSVQLTLLHASQTGACNAQHAVRERLARWLLLARDSLQSALVPLPQQVLARLIGVRRATISDTLRDMECGGVVRTTRCRVEIADAPALEAQACDCYRIIKKERQRLFG